MFGSFSRCCRFETGPCGKYADKIAQTECQQCEACNAGRWRSGCDSKSAGNCTTCSPGRFKAYATYQTLCSPRVNGVSVGCCRAAVYAAQKGYVGWCPRDAFAFRKSIAGEEHRPWPSTMLQPDRQTVCQRVPMDNCHKSPWHGMPCFQWEVEPVADSLLRVTLHRNGKPG